MKEEVTNIGCIDVEKDYMINYLLLSGKIESIIPEIAARKIVRRHFSNKGLEILIDELQEACDKYRASLGLHEAQDTEEWFKSLGITIDDFEEYVETQLMEQKMKLEIASKERVLEYFNQHKKDFASAVISHIVLPDEGQASLILSEIEDEGEDFSEMAKKHSIDKITRSAGGYIGEVMKISFDSAIADMVFNKELGEIVGPVPADNGFELIKVEAINEVEAINDQIQKLITDVLFNDWIKEQQ